MVDRRDGLARLITRMGGTGLGNILAALLDAAGPLAPVGAQAIYALEPLLRVEGFAWNDLGQMLEDPESLERLIKALRADEGAET